MFFRGNCNFKQGRSDLAPSAHSFLNGKQLLGMIAALMFSVMPFASADAADSYLGSTSFATNCSGCHSVAAPNYQTYAANTFVLSSLVNTANDGALVAKAVNPGYATATATLGNTVNDMDFASPQRSTLCTTATVGTTCTASTGAADISAYFASLLTPVVTNPGTITYGSGAAVSNQITGTYFVSSLTAGWSTAFSATGLPTGVTINATTGLISGTTPTVTAPTNYTVIVYAKNQGNATSGTATFTFTVNPPIPVITSAATVNVLVGAAFSYQITATNTPTNYYITGTWPAGLTPTSPNYTASGLITGIPTQIGTFATPFVEAYNISGWGTKTVTINVWGITSATTASGTVGATFPGYTITTNGTVAGSYTASGLPPGLSVNASTGAIAGIPTTAGTFNVTVSALTTLGTTSQTVTFTIAKGTQTISFVGVPTVVVGTSGSDAATVNSGLTLSYSTLSTGCSVNASTGLVTGIHAGTANCAITASQAGDANWNAATLPQTAFSIGQGSQTITVPTLTPASISVGGTSTASGATSSVGLTPVTYSSSAGCTASGTNGTTITGNSVGTCTITATQAGNADYLPASSSPASLAVGLIAQTITWTSTPAVVYGSGNSVTWTATATSGLTPVTFSTVSTGCSVTSTGTVTGLAAGTSNCAITATQAGNASYGVAISTLTVNVSKANQTIGTITFSPATLAVSGTTTASATATSTLAVSYGTTTPAFCSVNASTGLVTGLASGTCTITADQAGNTNYNAASQVTQNIAVGQGSQTITFGAAPAVSVNGTGTVTATASSTLTVTYSTTTAATCSVNAITGLVSGIAAGTCTIAANQTGDANYLAAPQVTQSFIIGQASQTITFAAAPAITFGGTGTVKATASSGLAVSYSSLTASVCSVNVSSGAVSGLTTGTCTVAANQAGNANYAAAPQVTQSIAIGQASQTITFGAAPTVAVGGTGTENATGGASGNPVIFTSLTTGVCTVSGTNGSTVNGVTKGTCTIAANQAGNASYAAAAQVTQNISVALLPPTANAATMSVQLNTPATLDLAPFVTGTTTSGINIAVAPAHGAAIVSGTKVTYTPANNYFGTDTFQYVAYGPGGTSSPATVTVTIIGRPDPTKDINVPSLINLQTETAKRFHQAQMFNFQQRMESLHHVIQADVATSYASRNRAMEMAGDVASLGGANLPPSASQPVSAAQSDSPMQTSGPSNAPGQNNDSPGVLSSVLLANSVVSVLTTSSVNLNLASLTNSGKSNGSGGLKIWGAGNLRYGTKNQPGGGSNIDFSTNGVSIGADQRFSDQLTLGMGIGYARDKNTIGTDGTGSTSTGNSVAAYASYQGSSTMFIDGLLGYGTLSMDTTRYVAPINDFARSNRSGNQTYGSLATGYEYRDEGMLLSPYARYDLGTDRLKAATETGAGLYALNYASQSTRSQQVSLGFRAESLHQIDAGTAQPRVRIEYQHHIEGAGQTSIAYADLISTRYNLTIPTTNSNSVVLGIGSGFALHNGLSLDIDYQRQHSTGQENSQAFNFRLSKYLD